MDKIESININDETICFIGDDEILAEGYTVVWNYFLNKWVPILGVGPSMLYIQILKRCFKDKEGGQKDIAFPKISTLCKELGIKSRTTLHKWLDLLEEYEFIQRFNRYNKEDNGKMLQTSNIYKVRLSIHLTPEDKKIKEINKKKLTEKNGIIIKTAKKRKKMSEEKKLLAQEISNVFNCSNKEILKDIKDYSEEIIKRAFEITKQGMYRKENRVSNPRAFFKATLKNIENIEKISPKTNTLQSRNIYAERFNNLTK